MKVQTTIKRLALTLLVGVSAVIQLDAQILKMDTSYIHFFSEAPLENIEAVNNKTNGLINTSNGEIVIIIPINSFEFDKELMKEHFNENYMETPKFKNATFKGKIVESVDWKKDGTIDATVKGTLTIHGVSKPRTFKGKMVLKKGNAHLSTSFKVKLEDHDIEIPTVVFQNIAEIIDVTARLYFIPK